MKTKTIIIILLGLILIVLGISYIYYNVSVMGICIDSVYNETYKGITRSECLMYGKDIGISWSPLE